MSKYLTAPEVAAKITSLGYPAHMGSDDHFEGDEYVMIGGPKVPPIDMQIAGEQWYAYGDDGSYEEMPRDNFDVLQAFLARLQKEKQAVAMPDAIIDFITACDDATLLAMLAWVRKNPQAAVEELESVISRQAPHR